MPYPCRYTYFQSKGANKKGYHVSETPPSVPSMDHYCLMVQDQAMPRQTGLQVLTKSNLLIASDLPQHTFVASILTKILIVDMVSTSFIIVVERALPSYFGPPTHRCMHCGATLWYEQRIKRNRPTSNPQFTFCCMEGRVKLPLLKEPPPLLKHLLGPDSSQLGSNFRRNIWPYNSMFVVASMGVQVDKLINN